jgi:hypothetical protein
VVVTYLRHHPSNFNEGTEETYKNITQDSDTVHFKAEQECRILGSILSAGLCGLVVRVLGYRSGGPGSIPGTTRKKSSRSGTGSTQSREYN